jgi:hypothetical protein
LGILSLALPRSAAAAEDPAPPPKKVDCAGAYERAQLDRREGKLQATKSELRACASAECRVTRADCIEWLDEVQRSLPSVVFAARTPSGDVLDVRVTVDGNEATRHLDGMAVELDPGVHTIRFELAGRPAIEMTVVLVVGQKNRVVDAVWRDELPTPSPAPTQPGPASPGPAPGLAPPVPPAPSAAPPPVTADVQATRPVPTAAYVLGGVGAAGLVGFAAFALVGQSKKSSLDGTCAPFCTSDDIGPAKTAFAVADVSLAVAVLGFGSAGVLYFTRPEVARAPATTGWAVSPAPGGARVDWRISF